MAALLEKLGYRIAYDSQQTCCGQPAFNAGNRQEALVVARNFLDVFSGADTVVCPSGSCTAMVRRFYTMLLREDPRRLEAERVAPRVFELSEFLVREGKLGEIEGRSSGRVGFHNSCHSYRELGIAEQPLALLRCVENIEVVVPDGEPICCGFGGLFCVKFEDIAGTMARTRLESFLEKGVDRIVSNDPGCLMHMRQEASARELTVEICHLADFLAASMGLTESVAGASSAE